MATGSLGERCDLSAVAIAFGVIFLAELGDKSQLVTIALATRVRPSSVLIGIALAAAATHGLSVAVGRLLAEGLPERPIAIVAGLTFLGFAAWTVRGGGDDDAEDAADPADPIGERRTIGVILAVAAAVFLSEVADKTMLASIALSARQGPLPTWVGATTGMVAADGVAIVVGRQLGSRLPDRAVRIGATVSFVGFGVLLVIDGILG